MTVADFLTLALDFAYLGVLVIAISEYRRRREPVGLAVVAVFAAVFVLFAFSAVGRILPQLQLVTGVSAFGAFLALPVLTLNLVRHFQAVPDWLMRTSVALAILLGLGTIIVVAGVATGTGTGTGPVLVLLLAALGTDLRHRVLRGPAFAVRPLVDHRVERIDQPDDAGPDRDLGTLQPVGVARAVPALVMVAHDRGELT